MNTTIYLQRSTTKELNLGAPGWDQPQERGRILNELIRDGLAYRRLNAALAANGQQQERS